ncbi:hypothetical protein NM208_g5202 [Fusarium decemcellulare]|uniref:Uncharacterized protein n=2 Tax=Fusarium decemcellulare TaxID=57161 RepID=A0ACC1SI26_9HYPO|nr:hypothetical protein NM208_g10297 [Fusarium decemcellulare]KAJ3540113.1 hypothetical protein NM208_g5202 [Fusarium decemcellulare]
MSTPKTIAVVGATGNQGSSVAKTFLSTPGWHVRALTRDPSSKKAQALKDLGAELVQAELEDIDSLTKAFQGAHAIFVNTDFWIPYQAALKAGHDSHTSEKRGYDSEVQNAKNAAIAASKTPGLEKYIYSALGPMAEASGGKYPHCHHWETKAAAVKFIERELPELNKKTSYIYLGAYSTNPLLYPKPNKETGEYEMVLPGPKEAIFPIINPETSTGPFVRALVEDEPAGTKLLAYDSRITIGEAVDVWSKVAGKKANYVQKTSQEIHETTGLPLEVLDGPAFMGEYEFTAGVEGVIFPEQLKNPPKTPSYPEFLASKDLEYLLGSEYPKW